LLLIFSSIASDRQQFQGDCIGEYIDKYSQAVFVKRGILYAPALFLTTPLIFPTRVTMLRAPNFSKTVGKQRFTP